MPLAHLIYARSHTVGGLWIRHHDDVAPRAWSHTGVLVGDVVWEARALRKVGPVPLADFLDRYPRTEQVSYDVPDPAAGAAWLEAQRGLRYDYLAVLGRLARRSWDEPGAWHCQELAEAYLAACGLRRFRSAPALITPNLGYMVL